jgi:hypothetical protein
MSRNRHGAAAICGVWLLTSLMAPALLLTDGVFLALLLSGAIFLGLALWLAVPLVACLLAVKHLACRRFRAALPLLALPVLGLLLCYGGARF